MSDQPWPNAAPEPAPEPDALPTPAHAAPQTDATEFAPLAANEVAPAPKHATPPPAPQYQVGDVINGHELTPHGWVPIAPPPPPQPQYVMPSAQTVPAPKANPAHVTIAWICTVVTFGYFLPWAIAATRAKSNTLSIAMINLFLGWTFIGWIIALVMSFGAERTTVVQQQVVVVNHPTPPPSA
jgi:hypothetical protein